MPLAVTSGRSVDLDGGEAGDLVAADRLQEGLDAAVDQAAERVTVHLDVADPGSDLDRTARRGPGEGDLDAMDVGAFGHVLTLGPAVGPPLPSN